MKAHFLIKTWGKVHIDKPNYYFCTPMRIYYNSSEITAYLQEQKKEGTQYGFVPTMGALHQGHLSLIERAKAENDFVVCSIFINPAQFNNPIDFKLYPKTIEEDISKLEEAGCGVVFIPDTSQIYPTEPDGNEIYNIGTLEFILEGEYRPGHFQGVCKVMRRLMDIVKPDRLYLGQKDFQQCRVIQKLLPLINQGAKIVICPIRREADGLALSSRNLRLSKDERGRAVGIFKALSFIRDNIRSGPLQTLKQEALDILFRHRFKVDYVEIAEPLELKVLQEWDGKTTAVALIAAHIGNVRLIDNMIITP